jgi:Fe-S cluster assembly iron-binding protein IscA
MDIVESPEKDDVVYDKDGLNVFVQKGTDSLFPDATIDFSDDYGFMITGQQCSCS